MSNKVRQANKFSAARLAASLPPDQPAGTFPYDFKVATSSDLHDDELGAIWNIFSDNMGGLYHNSSFGWDPPAKKRELFDRQSRFILAQDTRHNDEGRKLLVGFIMFRFERENNEDVVYCYEIQVSLSAQRNGLGKRLLQQVTSIGAQQGMSKIMLTAFKANTDALKFYEAFGFALDPTSPGYEDEPKGQEKVDYRILSKNIVAQCS